MSHFTIDNKTTWIKTLSMFLSMPFLLSGIWLFYEYWGQPKYWKNRWRLHRLLTKNKVKIVSKKNDGGKIVRYKINIEGIEYELDIWENNSFSGRSDEMTLGRTSNFVSESYIGLFKGSLITKWLNKKAIKAIKELSDPALQRDRKLRKLGI
jgi:hypothetical protein